MTRIAVITGAGSGIGNCLARKAVAGGWEVVGCDLETPNPDPKVPIRWVRGDIRDQRLAHESFQAVEPSSVSLVVCLAALGPAEPDCIGILDTNLRATLQFAKVALGRLEKGGLIVLVGSPAGLRYSAPSWLRKWVHDFVVDGNSEVGPADPLDDPSEAYAASKWGILEATPLLAKRALQAGVRVICVIPGPTQTRMAIQLKERKPSVWAEIARAYAGQELPEPDKIADAILTLASPDFAELHSSVLRLDAHYAAFAEGPDE